MIQGTTADVVYGLMRQLMPMVSACVGFTFSTSLGKGQYLKVRIGIAFTWLAFLLLFSLSMPRTLVSSIAGVTAGFAILALPGLASNLRIMCRIVAAFGAVGVVSEIMLHVFSQPEFFTFPPRLKGFLITFGVFALVLALLTAMALYLVHRSRWRWPFLILPVVAFAVFINAWLFIPLSCAFLLGLLCPSSECSALQQSVTSPSVLRVMSMAGILAFAYLFFDGIGLRSEWYQHGGSPGAALVFSSLVFYFYGRLLSPIPFRPLTGHNKEHGHLRLLLLCALVIVASAGCSRVGSMDPDIPRALTPEFRQAVDTLRKEQNLTLVCVTFRKSWHFIARNEASRQYFDFVWNGSTFNDIDKSSLISKGLVTDVYSRLTPLEIVWISVRYDYAEAVKMHRDIKVLRRHLFELPVPILTGIQTDSTARPIWILPYRKYPNEGFLGIYADTGEILDSVGLGPQGLKRRRWWE